MKANRRRVLMNATALAAAATVAAPVVTFVRKWGEAPSSGNYNSAPSDFFEMHETQRAPRIPFGVWPSASQESDDV